MAAEITKIDGTAAVHVAAEKPSDPLIYLIPGNPGLCEYYLDFVNELASLLPGHEIVAPSHRGYSLDSKAGELRLKSYNLNDQIRHKIEVLDSIVTQQRKVIVLGHSVGAWIAQRVVTHFKNHPYVNIEFVGLLTPTVKDIAKSPRGAKVSRLGRYFSPGFLAGALQILYYVMPNSFWRYLISRLFRKSKNPDYARQVSLKYAQRPSMIYQTLSLAAEEMVTIGPDPEPQDITGFWESSTYTVWGFFAHDDHWIAPATRQALFDAYGNKPNVHFEIVPDSTIPHAFCINCNRQAADLVASAIVKFEKHAQIESSIEELKPLEVVPEVREAEVIPLSEVSPLSEISPLSEASSPAETSPLAEVSPLAGNGLRTKTSSSHTDDSPLAGTSSVAATNPLAETSAPTGISSPAQDSSPQQSQPPLHGFKVPDTPKQTDLDRSPKLEQPKVHVPLERVATPTSQVSKDSDGSKTPQSSASKDSGRRSSIRRLSKVLSRKKKQA